MTHAWPRGRARDGGVDEIALPAGRRGRLWVAGKHAVAPDPELLMVATGVSTIVCLSQRHELVDRYPHYVTWLEAHRDGRAIWFPVADLHAPPVDAALGLLDRIEARLDRAESVLVHCGAGIGRAGTIAACVLVAMGVDEQDALAQVAAQRPMAGPEAGEQRALVRTVSERWRAAPSAPHSP